ncbi:MAG: crossover junction endodeoxyribonuclease RuvC [Brevinematales bacterium]|nr:crossover junction endodeoxyribonuclease RuvC [Brevinematales bacterium]
MKVLGIDPGYSILGYGIVENKENKLNLIKAGVLDTSDNKDFNEKLLEIHNFINSLIKNYHPDIVFIEEVFFGKNVKTATKVAQAVGVVKIEVLKSGIEILSITPLEVKKCITGSKGFHPKTQIQNIVKLLLNLDEIPKPDDCADAIAIALCGLFRTIKSFYL